MADDLAELLERAGRLHEERDQLAEELAAARARRPAEVAAPEVSTGKLLAIGLCGVTMVVLAGGGAWLWLQAQPARTWNARVIDHQGSAPSAPGAACTVALSPGYGRVNAWMQVDCEGQRIVGWDILGGVRCETLESGTVACTDDAPIGDDGDPTKHLDEAASELVLTDGAAWSLTLALD